MQYAYTYAMRNCQNEKESVCSSCSYLPNFTITRDLLILRIYSFCLIIEPGRIKLRTWAGALPGYHIASKCRRHSSCHSPSRAGHKILTLEYFTGTLQTIPEEKTL